MIVIGRVKLKNCEIRYNLSHLAYFSSWLAKSASSLFRIDLSSAWYDVSVYLKNRKRKPNRHDGGNRFSRWRREIDEQKIMTEKLRIVIADDERPARLFLKNILQEFADAEIVGEAADGAEAVEIIGEIKPDLALLDLQMPVLSGIQI